MAEPLSERPPPRFVSFEGVDGSGKTTQAARLAAHLRAQGHEVVEVREPGGTAAGERVRAVVLDAGTRLGPRAEALLLAGARAQLVDEVIEPALARGAFVVADRFVDSSYVYQGEVRGLGAAAVGELNAFATAGRLPDRTVLLRIGAEAAAARRDDGAGDRFESEPDAFLEQVVRAYDATAARAGARIVAVSGEGDAGEVALRVREALGVR